MQTIVTLGPLGTYSLIAAEQFLPNAHIELKGSLDEIFLSLKSKEYAVVPIRNSISGTVMEILSYLRSEEYHIVDVIDILLSHVLAGLKDGKVLYAHPHAYYQCKHTLERLGIDCLVIFTKSNGETAERLRENPDALGIISKEAAKEFEMPIVSEDISDSTDNQTRFLVLQKV